MRRGKCRQSTVFDKQSLTVTDCHHIYIYISTLLSACECVLAYVCLRVCLLGGPPQLGPPLGSGLCVFVYLDI